ncbi:MAG: cation-translocating P-type ATPase [Rhodocyclaceae bacterium]|nr:cation-translocating P-type ATPase [Rhodocyclaceae bacterium]
MQQVFAGMSPSSGPGLSRDEVAQRRLDEGWNELATDQNRGLAAIALEVLREPMFLLLVAAGGIYLAMGDAREALVLLGFVLIIMTVTILQERRTEKALEALRDLSSPRALVIREGETVRIAGREVVRDDLVLLEEGDRIPADGLLLEAHELACDESLLTGESVAVSKFAGEGESGQVFAGTLAVAGQGLMRVTATGSRTELGRIGKSLADIPPETSPLQGEIALLTRRLAVIGVLLCLATAALYLLLRGDLLAGLLAGITLAMGILPQEFPVILIIFLALGARRVARERVLTRRLSAIETLGETTVLCVDKTGTLTENRMALASLVVDGRELAVSSPGGPQDSAALPEPYHELLEYCVLASEIAPRDPMEQAFHLFARSKLAETEHLHPDWALAREYELSPEMLAMSHLWRPEEGEAHVVAAKGAPEAICDLCHLGEAERQRIAADAERLADRGLRVLGVAKARHDGAAWPEIQHDFDFSFIGLVGLADPLRPGVPAAIAECRHAGIRVVMITGDHPHTARAIAEQAGLLRGTVLTGQEMDALPKNELAARIGQAEVFARVTPQQKLAIVEALKASGEIVAMTGDGVNDAPALKAAHIGISMGRRGTDVAREAGALVLLDDDFAAIVSAIRLGRRIFSNLRQALIYTLAVHVPIIGLSIIPLLFGWPLVLAPMHIAFLELVIAPACSVVFEAEAEHGGLMHQPPRPRSERLVAGRHLMLAMLQGLASTAVIVALYHWSLVQGEDTARALAFITLVSANAALVFASRSPRPGLLPAFRGVPPVGLAVLAATLASLLATVTLPDLAAAFRFATPEPGQSFLALAAGLSCLALFEAAKYLLAAQTRQLSP